MSPDFVSTMITWQKNVSQLVTLPSLICACCTPMHDTNDYTLDYFLWTPILPWSPVLFLQVSFNLLTWNCRFISLTVSLATLSERPARFQQETECGSGVIIYCRAQALIFTDVLYSITPFLSRSIFTPHIRAYIIAVSMAMGPWSGYWLNILKYSNYLFMKNK